jgi:hypothetical protein
VHKVTTLLVVRYRFEVTLPGSRATITQVAEDAHFLAFTAAGDQVHWLSTDQVDQLLTIPPTSNVADALADTQLTRALHRLPDLHQHLEATGRHKADQLVAEHRDVRAGSRAGGKTVNAKLLPPPDVLGVYVFLPEGGAG